MNKAEYQQRIYVHIIIKKEEKGVEICWNRFYNLIIHVDIGRLTFIKKN